MGQRISMSSKPFLNFTIIPFKRCSPRNAPGDRNILLQAEVESKPITSPVKNSNDFVHLISDCICAASTRTQEYLVFKDPEEKFHPSPQVFLMTYITQTFCFNLTDTFSCTVMTREQRILLGADWVWAVLEKPTKNPRIQIFVQVLHLPEGGKHENTAEVVTESILMAQTESSYTNKCKRMVDLCASIGRDCYALFLFFGKPDDTKNIYGVLSNNFEIAVAKYNNMDRTLIENFFTGLQYFHTPLGMMQSIFTNKMREPLTLIARFS